MHGTYTNNVQRVSQFTLYISLFSDDAWITNLGGSVKSRHTQLLVE